MVNLARKAAAALLQDRDAIGVLDEEYDLVSKQQQKPVVYSPYALNTKHSDTQH